MATVNMMQGDSYAVYIDLEQSGVDLTPEMVSDIEVSVGENLRKTYSGGGVGYDAASQRWYIRPTQEETLALEADGHEVIARVKYRNTPIADVKGISVGRIKITESLSKEVI